MYALIDSNNFFVSCERLFRPDLEGKPVVVLSSNDGCAVSRSAEVKALGIPMGAPAFKYRELFQQHGVVSFSANFELYGDISERITTLLTTITPHLEIYSVDECFLDLSELAIADYETWGRAIKAQLLQSVGIPVSVGVAPTKTLCKTANHWAKKHSETGGSVCMPSGTPRSHSILQHTPIEDVWGVGWRLAPKLKAEGVYTAADFMGLSPRRAAQLMGIQGRRMHAELHGTRCYDLQPRSTPQHIISRGRQFGSDTNDLETVEAALTTLASRAAAELRREAQLAQYASICLSTNRHKPGYLRKQYTVRFMTPTADTGLLCSRLAAELRANFSSHHFYHKAEIVLTGLTSAHTLQTDLLGEVDLESHIRSHRRMKAFDHINTRYGAGTVTYAASQLSEAWRPRSASISPRYTSSWDELPSVRTI